MSPHAEIQSILERARFAVLATQDRGQPHASLVAVIPTHGGRSLLFATYRATRKYANLSRSNRVAMFIGDPSPRHSISESSPVLTVHGLASEAPSAQHVKLACKHTKRHPQLVEMLDSRDCALFLVSITAYEVVQSIDQVRWYISSDSDEDERPDTRSLIE